MLGKKLRNALFNCTSLPKERNRSYTSSNKIESKYDRMKGAEGEDCEREDRDHEGENQAMRDRCKPIVRLDCTFPRKEKRLCVSGKKIESKYD